MAAGHVDVAIPTLLHGCKGLLADDGGYWHGHPLVRWGGLLTLTSADGLYGRLTAARWRRVRSPTLSDAQIRRGTQDASARGHGPACPASGGGKLGITETFGDRIETDELARGVIPRKHWLHYGGLDGIKAHPAGLTGTRGIEQIAVGGTRPGQPLATTQLRLTTPSHALGNQGALILGYGRADL